MPADAVVARLPAAPRPRSPLREFWGYFSANKGAVAGLVFVVAITLVAVFAPWLAPHPPDLTNNTAFLKPPVWQAGSEVRERQNPALRTA